MHLENRDELLLLIDLLEILPPPIPIPLVLIFRLKILLIGAILVTGTSSLGGGTSSLIAERVQIGIEALEAASNKVLNERIQSAIDGVIGGRRRAGGVVEATAERSGISRERVRMGSEVKRCCLERERRREFGIREVKIGRRRRRRYGSHG